MAISGPPAANLAINCSATISFPVPLRWQHCAAKAVDAPSHFGHEGNDLPGPVPPQHVPRHRSLGVHLEERSVEAAGQDEDAD
jgi:hypothetical protein